MSHSGELSSIIGMSAPGEKVKLKIWRDHGWHEVEAKLGSADDSSKLMADNDSNVQGGQIGLALRSLTPQERHQAKIDEGLVVEQVAGPAARAGIEPGDLLLAINGKPASSVEAVKKVLDNKPKSVALLVQRNGEKIFVPVKLG